MGRLIGHSRMGVGHRPDCVLWCSINFYTQEQILQVPTAQIGCGEMLKYMNKDIKWKYLSRRQAS